MKTLMIELRKEKRTGILPILLAMGVLGAAYAFHNQKGYLIKFAASSNGYIINTTLWNAHGFKYVWNYCCNMYDL